MVLLIDESDHITGLAGATLSIMASKDGSAFASISPTVTDRGDGVYSIALTTTHTNTLGALWLHITATGADPLDVLAQVVAELPGGPVSVATGGIASTAFAAGAITASAIAADAITSSQLATSAVTEIVTAVLTTQMTESYNADGAAPTIAQALCLLISATTEFSISGTLITCKKLDGTTTAATYSIDSATLPTSRARAS